MVAFPVFTKLLTKRFQPQAYFVKLAEPLITLVVDLVIVLHTLCMIHETGVV